jgi:hypothetical protein
MAIYKNVIPMSGRVALNCFYCRETLDEKVNVYWNGSNPHEEDSLDIALHAECASKLSIHLASDSLRARDRTAIARLEEREFDFPDGRIDYGLAP